MKKIGILFLTVLLVVAFTMPAAALENVFGGYWRTRFISQQDFSGEDATEAQDLMRVDTRTRLYYTAILNENLKFVNKFEFDAVWGDTGYGDIGADGVLVEIKQSYADFNMGPVNAKVGVQGVALSRGFLFDDEFAGANVAFKGEGFSIPIIWMKPVESGTGMDNNDDDYYVLNPSFSVGDKVTINPIVIYRTLPSAGMAEYYFGVNVDAGPVWFSGILENGEVTDDIDSSAYLLALGGKFNLGAAGINAQVFYATGDDDLTDNDQEAFTAPPGVCYYWSEIMGYGTFDNQVSNGSPAANITNIMAANVGVSFKATDALKLSADLWYAKLVEDDALGNTSLGTELDLKATFALVEGLNLDVVAAYLFAGDSTTLDSADDANPYELGARLSLSF